MAELEQNILEFIEDVKPVIKKELAFIKKKDWTINPIRKKREDAQTLENLIANRAIKNAERLYELAGNNISHPTVNKVMTDLVSFYEISKKRYDSYTKKEDWTTYTDEDDQNAADEIEFQSKILKDVGVLRDLLKGINFGSANKSLEIKTFNKVPIPLVMAEKALRRYPEIENYLEVNEKSGIFDKRK